MLADLYFRSEWASSKEYSVQIVHILWLCPRSVDRHQASEPLERQIEKNRLTFGARRRNKAGHYLPVLVVRDVHEPANFHVAHATVSNIRMECISLRTGHEPSSVHRPLLALYANILENK